MKFPPIYCRRERILVLGDSHAQVFRNWRFRLYMPCTRFDLRIVGGATLSGLDNPNSKTQAGTIFRSALENANATRVVTLLGEVDTGFVIWYRAGSRRTSLESALGIALHNYESLLRAAIQVAPALVVSAPLPTIGDGQTWGDVANLRKEVTATQVQRTELTLRFNKEMQKVAEAIPCGFLSLDNACLGDDGRVASQLLNDDPLDHHYNVDRYAGLLGPRIVAQFRNGMICDRAAMPRSAAKSRMLS